MKRTIKERSVMTSPTDLPAVGTTVVDPPGVTDPGSGPRGRPAWSAGVLRLDRYSGLYLAVILAVVFSVLLPDTFGTLSNARVIAASSAIAGILTLAVAVSMAAGTFDISLAANMTFSICLLGTLLTSADLPWVLAVILTLLAGASIGAVNALIITRLGVEPIVATLGMSSVLAALSFWVADGQTILLDGVSPTFTEAGQATIATVPITVFYLAAVALVLWFLLEHTPLGRYIYAIGSNPQAAKLAGIKVLRLQSLSLMMTGALAALAGVVLTMQLGASAFGAGAPYLLPAFAATFLGATQILPGRFNVRGTIIALYLLAIAVKGLQLQFPDLPWIKDLVEGTVLIVAVSITARAIRQRRTR
ncbi:ribose transport system permease protein [Geodermatophilus sabuli]|uniref:Ribose transport system permease protein n=2 Tax=Geodermatophilus sabuli TaxID=1564158 RepID=A0A285EAL5_9ACTN|nr:ribose transport system permease protein [Geodermatophilus sabuli]